MRVIVHGGAGSPPDEPPERQDVLNTAAATGSEASSPTEAVVTATRILERDPKFNAGTGGAIQSDGIIRTDAGVMTQDRAVGAAAAMPGVEAAVEVARIIKNETPHVLVAGVHAVDLADAFGVATDVDLLSERTEKRWTDLKDRPPVEDIRAQLDWQRERFGTDDGNGSDHDTVGAVATDGERIATATSTGGRWLALAGRVGDVPQVGAGFYCTAAAGASATGAGEDIARVTLSRRAVDLVANSMDPQTAATEAITEFETITGSTAGVIVAAPDGRVGEAFNSEAMQTAVSGEV